MITPLPEPPTRANPSGFSGAADTFLSALPVFATEANELQVDVNAKQTAAEAAKTAAEAAQLAAQAASNASIWVSGTTYAVGNVRFSPINFRSYRRKTNGAGTTDPSADSTNWQLLTGLGDVDLNSTQTLTNKTFSTGSTWNGNAVPIANGGTGATTAAQARTNLGTNDAGNLTTGTVNTGRLGSGIQDSSTYLAGDGTWKSFSTEVFADIAGAGIGAVGTYAILFSSTSVTYGSTYAGSSLRFQGMSRASDNVLVTQNGTGPTASGTWLCLGSFTSSTGGLAFFVRIS